MRKIISALCFFVILTSAVVLVGCTPSDNPGGDSTPPADSTVRYTVTEEEWNLWTTYPNYTIEEYTDSYRLVHKYTENALEFIEGTIVVIDGEKDYQLIKKGDVYVAYDCTSLELFHGGLLAGGYVFDEFVYNEDICAYELDLINEMGSKWEVKFENGVPVSIIYTSVTVEDGVEKTSVLTKLYTNVGTTVINVPDYVFEEDFVIRTTVTEEEWNNCVNAGSFAGDFSAVVDTENFELYSCSFKCEGNAIELDGKIIVFEGDKKYMLEESNGTWYANEWNEYNICSTLIPADLDFNDFEYSEVNKAYISKQPASLGLYYTLCFEEGELVSITAQKSLDSEDPGYFDMFDFYISQIGSITIDVPEYVMGE